MTRLELSEALAKLTDEQFDRFKQAFGGEPGRSREAVVREFVHHPEHERRLCQLLELPTEDEKLVGASSASASAAKDSARAAESSARWAKWSVAVAALGVLISLVALGLALARG